MEGGSHHGHKEDYMNRNESLINASFPRTNGKANHYNTFGNDNKVTEEFRTRSVSVPYLACNSSRSLVKRTSSTYETRVDFENQEKCENRTQDVSSEHDSVNSDSKELEDDENTPMSSRCFCGFTKRQVKCGVALILLSFTDVMGFSIFAPFFPLVAEQKGMSPVQIGVIFAAFSMAGIFASLLTGTLLVKVGAKFIIVSGMFWSAGSTICFGLLRMVYPEYFFALCFLCRIIMGVGSSSAFTALFAVIFQEFSDRSLTMIGISESFCSIGGILGPLLGGALYDLGGYELPFMFLGAAQLLILIICIFMIPPVAVQRQADAVSPARLLLNVHGFFSALFVVLSFTVNAFIVANLSQFLTHSFGTTAFMVGVFMLVFSIFYGVSTPIWGYITDLKDCGAHMMAGTSLVSGIVLAFFGPSDIVRNWFGWSEPREWLVYVTVGLLGTCMGGLVMPTFGEMVVAAKEMKLHRNPLAEYGLVSGLWNTMFSIGDILGPTAGGALVEKFDFQNTCAIFGAMLFVAALAKIIHLVVEACRHKKDGETEVPEVSSDEDDDGNGERTGLLSRDNPTLQV